MRKLWYAGAVVAGGMLLFGASPARADLLPGTGTAEQQADERLADLLGRSNGVNVSNPLRYSTMGETPVGSRPVVQFHSGDNSPDLNPLLPGEEPGEAPGEAPAETPGSDHSGEAGTDLPATDAVKGALRPTGGVPAGGLLHRLPLFGGLLPDGGMSSALQRPTVRQSESFDGGLPLLGGLGGVLPVNDRPRTPGGDGPDTTGLPAGGVAVLPAATAVTATVPPASGQPGQPGQPDRPEPDRQLPVPDATPDDPRLHEEPIDSETTRRPFSDGRPVAGVDQDYK